MRTLKYILIFLNFFFCPQKVEKTTSKSCILNGSWDYFFSAAPTAQNSPELHFRFINSFIQSSLLRSLIRPQQKEACMESSTIGSQARCRFKKQGFGYDQNTLWPNEGRQCKKLLIIGPDPFFSLQPRLPKTAQNFISVL